MKKSFRTKPRTTKKDIDIRVSVLLGEKETKVSLITALFLRRIVEELIQEHEVYLMNIGIFRLELRKDSLDHQVNARVHFTKRAYFRRRLQETYVRKESLMEKYGVDQTVQQLELEKAASQGCPECGSKVEKHGITLVCPKCGSAPFEGKKTK